MTLRFFGILLALSLTVSCANLQQAPQNLVAIDYTFASASGEADTTGAPTADTDITGFDVRYEFLPWGDNANVSLAYISREDEFDAPATGQIESDIIRAQVLWHFELYENLTWFLGPGVGLAISVDSNARGADYGTSLYYDAETGIRWKLDEQWGIQGGINYSMLNASGDSGTPDTDLSGFSAFGGVYMDF